MIMYKFQSIKGHFQEVLHQIGQYIFAVVFVFKKVKNTLAWTYVIEDFNGKEI